MTLASAIAFAKKHWTALGGEPWEIDTGEDGGEPGWLYSEYFLPLHSYRLWPVDKEALCRDCKGLAGGLTEDYFASEPTRSAAHQAEHSCHGLTSEPIQFVFLDLPRRSGKTVGTSGYVGSLLFTGRNQSVTFMAGSEDQVTELFARHYQAPIVDNPALLKRADVRGTSVRVTKLRNSLRVIPTAISGATGGGQTLLVIDECRIVPPEVFAALVPQIFDQNGWECPIGGRGHTRTTGDLEDPGHLTHCTACHERLVPWVGRCLAMSSAGEIKDGADWFRETVEVQLKDPDPRAHVYSVRGEVIGKNVARGAVSAATRIFGGVSSLAAHIDIETENVPRRRGEDWLSARDIDAAIDDRLVNAAESDRPCVGFLDTSATNELTSLVIVADDSDQAAEDAWARLVMARIDIWDPTVLPDGIVDDREVEAHLDRWVPRFPLVALRVDTRGSPWAVRLVKRCKRKSWGRIVDGINWRDAERKVAWASLEAHIRALTIRLHPDPRLRSELLAARRFYDVHGRVDVREASRKQKHLDVAESLAACAFLTHQQTVDRPALGMAQLRSGQRIDSAIRGGSGRGRTRRRGRSGRPKMSEY